MAFNRNHLTKLVNKLAGRRAAPAPAPAPAACAPLPQLLLAAFRVIFNQYETRPELLKAEGIFRVPASKSYITAVIAHLLQPEAAAATAPTPADSTPVQVADALLTLARQNRPALLPQGLTEVMLDTFICGAASSSEDSTTRIGELRQVIAATLTPDALAVCEGIFAIFAGVVAHTAANKMTPANLAVCVCNALLGPAAATTPAAAKPSKPSDIKEMERAKAVMEQRQKLFVFLLEHRAAIFKAPESAAPCPAPAATIVHDDELVPVLRRHGAFRIRMQSPAKACPIEKSSAVLLLDTLFDDEMSSSARPRTSTMQFGPLKRRGAFKVCCCGTTQIVRMMMCLCLLCIVLMYHLSSNDDV